MKADSLTYTVAHLPCKRPSNQQLGICNVKGGQIEVNSCWLKLLPHSQISHNAQFTPTNCWIRPQLTKICVTSGYNKTLLLCFFATSLTANVF